MRETNAKGGPAEAPRAGMASTLPGFKILKNTPLSQDFNAYFAMEEFLAKIGLSSRMTLVLHMSRTDFMNTLQANIDPPQQFFDIFAERKNKYSGTIAHDNFNIRRRKMAFENSTANLTLIKGTVLQRDEKLEIDLRFVAFSRIFIPFVIFLIVAYAIGFVSILTIDSPDVMMGLMLPFMIIHAVLMFRMPYFFLKRSLKSVQYDIERDLYFMMKDKLNTSRL